MELSLLQLLLYLNTGVFFFLFSKRKNLFLCPELTPSSTAKLRKVSLLFVFTLNQTILPGLVDTRNVEALLLKGNVLLDLKKLADAMNHFRDIILPDGIVFCKNILNLNRENHFF